MLQRIGDRPTGTTIANGANVAIEIEGARGFAWVEGAIGADEALSIAYQVLKTGTSPDTDANWLTLDTPLALLADTARAFVFRSTGQQARVLVSNSSGSTATLSTFEVNGRPAV